MVLALFASTQGLLFAQGAFSVNRDWIAATLCVNQDRPELDCDGVCELTKRIDVQQEREEQNRAAGLEIALGVSAVATDRLGVAPDADALAHRAERPADVRTPTWHAQGGVFHPPRIG